MTRPRFAQQLPNTFIKLSEGHAPEQFATLAEAKAWSGLPDFSIALGRFFMSDSSRENRLRFKLSGVTTNFTVSKNVSKGAAEVLARVVAE